MSILYIEDKIKEKERQKEVLKVLSDIGLEPEDLSEHYREKLQDLIQQHELNGEDTLIAYQEWVKERFFQEYELNEHKIISPKFGDKKEI